MQSAMQFPLVEALRGLRVGYQRLLVVPHVDAGCAPYKALDFSDRQQKSSFFRIDPKPSQPTLDSARSTEGKRTPISRPESRTRSNRRKRIASILCNNASHLHSCRL